MLCPSGCSIFTLIQYNQPINIMAVKLWKLEYHRNGKIQETHCKDGVAWPIAIATMNRLATSTHRGGKFYVKPHSFVRPAESAKRTASLEAFKAYMAARINVASNGGKWVSMKNFIKSNGA